MSDPAPGPHDGVLAPGALGEDSLERYLDLGPFLNTSYHVVQVGARQLQGVGALPPAMHFGHQRCTSATGTWHLALLPSSSRHLLCRSL